MVDLLPSDIACCIAEFEDECLFVGATVGSDIQANADVADLDVADLSALDMDTPSGVLTSATASVESVKNGTSTSLSGAEMFNRFCVQPVETMS
ncbi:MAG: hypothetical protein VYA84_05190 [Planctomycetota bacterium]|nr:hypothetical protein [Planctomycetota bacterium]